MTPLPSPGRRALWLLPVAILLLIAASAVMGLRHDARRLGWGMSWGLSIFESGLGLALVWVALRESVPGRALSRRAILGFAGAALVAVATITLGTWLVSPTRILREPVMFVWEMCFTFTLGSAIPALVASAILSRRAFPLRPAVAGALYGLGAGLMADAGWRLFCHYSDPLHVFSAHLTAVVGAGLAGLTMAQLIRRR